MCRRRDTPKIISDFQEQLIPLVCTRQREKASSLFAMFQNKIITHTLSEKDIVMKTRLSKNPEDFSVKTAASVSAGSKRSGAIVSYFLARGPSKSLPIEKYHPSKPDRPAYLRLLKRAKDEVSL